MRSALFIALLFAIPTMAGCTAADWIFAAFGGAYSGGGTSALERRQDFDSRVEASQRAATYGIAE
jgi:hypothetical protein